MVDIFADNYIIYNINNYCIEQNELFAGTGAALDGTSWLLYCITSAFTTFCLHFIKENNKYLTNIQETKNVYSTHFCSGEQK